MSVKYSSTGHEFSQYIHLLAGLIEDLERTVTKLDGTLSVAISVVSVQVTGLAPLTAAIKNSAEANLA